MTIALDREYTNAEIEHILSTQLNLYTSLWFVTLTNQSYNLTFTTILLCLFPTLLFIRKLKEIAIMGA